MNYQYDSQQPSTSQQPHAQDTPETSPSWTHNPAGQPLQTSTPAAPTDWLHPLQPPQRSQSLLSISSGGVPMRRQLVAMRRAQKVAEWEGVAGPVGAAAAANAGRSVSRASSIMSDSSAISGISGISGVSEMSNTSTMTGLSVRTDYEPEQVNRLVLEHCLVEQAPRDELQVEETPLERQFREMMLRNPQERIFTWLAGERTKEDPNYREYRKKVLRAYSQKDKTKPAEPAPLKQLADRFLAQMRSLLIDLMWDIHNGLGKVKTDALNSLLDCAKAAPETIAFVLLNPPPKSSPSQKISIEVLLDCVDRHGGGDAIVAAQILLLLQQPPMPKRLVDRIQVQGRTVEGTRSLLSTLLHHSDAAPKKRIVLVDALKKYAGKSVVLEAGGIAELLRFLDRESEDAGTAPPPHNTLLLVEKDAVLIYHILSFLRGLVAVSRDGKIPRTRARCIDEMVKDDGVRILSFWLPEFGMPQSLNEIAKILANISDSQLLIGRDLTAPITRAIQAVGADDHQLAFFLIAFLRNVSRMSTAHKKIAIDLSVCAVLIDLIDKWAAVSVVHSKAPRFCLNTISIAVETLHTLTEPDQHHVHTAALDSLLKAKDSAIENLQRVVSFDFIYDNIRKLTDVQQRGVAYDHAMLKLPPADQVIELNTKNYALAVLCRMLERVQNNVASLNLSSVQEPLLGESLAVMVWRRMYDLYQQSMRIAYRPPPGASQMELDPIFKNITTLHKFASLLYRDPACLHQTLSLIGVPTSAPEGTLARFNPFLLLCSPYQMMAAAMLSIVDVVMHYFKAHGVRTYKHPMAVWLLPGARPGGGDYKQDFSRVVFQDLQQLRLLDADITQRLSNYFSECLGAYSPALTPAFASHPQMMMPQGGYRQ